VTDYAPTDSVRSSQASATTINASNPLGLHTGKGIIDHSCFDKVNSTALVGFGLAIVRPTPPSSISNVTDGLSSTILIAESAGRPLRYIKGGVRLTTDDAVTRAVGGNLTSADQDQFVNGAGWARPLNILVLLGAKDDGSSWQSSSGWSATDVVYAVNRTNGHGVDLSQTYTSYLGPEDARYPSDMGPEGSGEIYAFHPGGANVALGDGAVRFVSENILLTTFSGLVTRAGNENIDLDTIAND
jgi:prepilin-type processing-associated H-X9-DG protein